MPEVTHSIWRRASFPFRWACKKLTPTSTNLIRVLRRETISDLLKEEERTPCINLRPASAG